MTEPEEDEVKIFYIEGDTNKLIAITFGEHGIVVEQVTDSCCYN